MHRNEIKGVLLRQKNKKHGMHGNQVKEFQQVQSKIRELSCTEMKLKE